jgi:hypothetical protein
MLQAPVLSVPTVKFKNQSALIAISEAISKKCVKTGVLNKQG